MFYTQRKRSLTALCRSGIRLREFQPQPLPPSQPSQPSCPSQSSQPSRRSTTASPASSNASFPSCLIVELTGGAENLYFSYFTPFNGYSTAT